MQLSPQDIAAAEACGVTFVPATAAQVQRLAMQRKVFHAGGQAVLATRGDGFYETVGTLQRVIEEGLQQQRDLAAWQGSLEAGEAAPPPAEPDGARETPAAEPEPQWVMEEAAPPPAEPAGAVEAPATEAQSQLQPAAEGKAAPKRRRRGRPAAMPVTKLWLAEAEEAPAAVASPPLPCLENSAGDAAGRSARRGQRWMVAGAVRRGRAEKHWSQRQR